MTQVAEIKSPHEQRLEDNIAGKEDIYRESHKRVFKLLERFDGQKPAIDVERALYFTQSMAETVGQPLVLRWAKALMNVAKNITVMVQDDQLLLGRCVVMTAVTASCTPNSTATSSTSPCATFPPARSLRLPSAPKTPRSWLSRSLLSGRAAPITKL